MKRLLVDDDQPRECTACPEHARPNSRCKAEFVCETCGRLLNVCAHLPGGLDATKFECSACQLRRELLESRRLRRRLKA